MAFCPKDIPAIDAEGKVVIIRIDACTYCGLCELRCPDFAIILRDTAEGDSAQVAVEPRQESSEL